MSEFSEIDKCITRSGKIPGHIPYKKFGHREESDFALVVSQVYETQNFFKYFYYFRIKKA